MLPIETRPIDRQKSSKMGVEEPMADPVVHFEIISSEAPNLQRFYGSVFGWRIAVDNPFGYGMVDTKATGRGINGGIGTPLPGGRGHFTIYVQVPNIDAALSRVITEGGRIALPKTTVPNGPTMAQFFDPAGHLMGLIEGTAPPDSAPRARVAATPRTKVVVAPPAKPAAPAVKAAAAPKAKPAAKPQKAAAKAKPKAKAKPAKKPAKAAKKAAPKAKKKAGKRR
jgi:predicted enzyme related to lactoylglutathione lyase